MASNLANVDAYINGPAEYEGNYRIDGGRLRPRDPDVQWNAIEARWSPAGHDRPRQQVVLELDRRVVEAFKETGPDWQDRINDVLRAGVTRRVA